MYGVLHTCIATLYCIAIFISRKRAPVCSVSLSLVGDRKVLQSHILILCWHPSPSCSFSVFCDYHVRYFCFDLLFSSKNQLPHFLQNQSPSLIKRLVPDQNAFLQRSCLFRPRCHGRRAKCHQCYQCDHHHRDEPHQRRIFNSISERSSEMPAKM